MRFPLILSLVLLWWNASAQVKNSISLFTRPVIVHTQAYKDKFTTSNNVFVGAACEVKKWDNRSNITTGFYVGFNTSTSVFESMKKGINFKDENRHKTSLGISVRYYIYISKNYRFSAHFGILGEVYWTDGARSYSNITNEGVSVNYNEFDEIYLSPHQTIKNAYNEHALNLFLETGSSYYFTKRIGITASVLCSLYNYDLILNTGLNYKF
jgi:hypothetical protein